MLKNLLDDAKNKILESKIGENHISKEITDGLNKTFHLGQEVASDKILSLVDEFNAALPYLSKAGYTLHELEVELGLPPKLIPHFVYSADLDSDEGAAVENLEDNRFGYSLLKVLRTAGNIQEKLQFNNMLFSHVEIELSFVPNIRLAYKMAHLKDG